jgi:hypothetical protein
MGRRLGIEGHLKAVPSCEFALVFPQKEEANKEEEVDFQFARSAINFTPISPNGVMV